MITKRLIVLQALVLLGLGCVLLIPHNKGLGPAGIAMTLPNHFESWQGTDAPVKPEELNGLAPDTEFVRQFYTNNVGDTIYVSIVLSGEDMTNSIHRPERCLTAQGWTVEHSARVRVPVSDGQTPVEVTKLTDVKEGHSPDGRTIPVKNLNYYWFIGSKDITASHWTRTFLDARDRVLRGENQRWAYVTVTTNVTANLKPGGRDEAYTTRLLEDFIGEIVPRFRKPGAPGSEQADTTPKAQAGAATPSAPGV